MNINIYIYMDWWIETKNEFNENGVQKEKDPNHAMDTNIYVYQKKLHEYKDMYLYEKK